MLKKKYINLEHLEISEMQFDNQKFTKKKIYFLKKNFYKKKTKTHNKKN